MKNHSFFHCAVAATLLVACVTLPVEAAKKNKQVAQQKNARQAMMRAQNMAQRAQMQQRARAAASPMTQGAGRKNKRGGESARRGKDTVTVQPPDSAKPSNVAEVQVPPLSRSRREVSDAAAKIDALVLSRLAEAKQKPNLPASDEQFLRRIYISAAGRIPTATEAKAFLSSNAPDKRAQLIDTLLVSDGYASQSFNWLAGMLRVKDKVGKGGVAYAYEEWLKDRITANSPWNEIVFQMMTAEGSLATEGATGYLLRDPGMPLDNLSNTLTTFLGANIACAQCHDHPLAPWTQRQFYEMAGFFEDVDANVVRPNALVKKVLKQSDKLDESDKKLLLRLAQANSAQVRVVPGKSLKFPADYKYKDAKPGELVHPALFTWEPQDKQSPAYAVDLGGTADRRKAFASWLTHPDNPRFAVAIANRLWQKNFGLGVQEPLTDLDKPDEASNPALLVHLAAEMKRLNFDMREFQRVLYNTKTYQQQTSITPDLGKGDYLFPGPVLRRMTAEQTWDSVLTLAVGTDLDLYKLKRAETLQQFVIPGKQLTVKALEAKALALRGQKIAAERPMNSYEAEGGKTTPPHFAGLILARASELEQPSKESHFLRMFGQSDRDVADDASLEGGIPQVLMMMNGNVQTVLAHPGSLALKTANSFSSSEQRIESLYISYLGRRPTATEKSKVQRALSEGMTLPELTWVLFNTREFIFVQ